MKKAKDKKERDIIFSVHAYYPQLLSISEKQYIESFEREFNPTDNDEYFLKTFGPLGHPVYDEKIADEHIREIYELFLDEEKLILGIK